VNSSFGSGKKFELQGLQEATGKRSAGTAGWQQPSVLACEATDQGEMRGRHPRLVPRALRVKTCRRVLNWALGCGRNWRPCSCLSAPQSVREWSMQMQMNPRSPPCWPGHPGGVEQGTHKEGAELEREWLEDCARSLPAPADTPRTHWQDQRRGDASSGA
jgi:hypothetical protein